LAVQIAILPSTVVDVRLALQSKRCMSPDR
jgi:hypothetical protein